MAISQRKNKSSQISVSQEAIHISYCFDRTKSKTITKKIEIPSHLKESPLILSIKEHFNVIPATTAELQRDVANATRFLNYLGDQFASPDDIPPNLLTLYRNHLTDACRISTGSTLPQLRLITKAITNAKKSSWYNSLPLSEKTKLLSIVANRPSISNKERNAQPASTISELVPELNLDDWELLTSLTEFCIGFLSEYEKHREIICSYGEFERALDNLDHRMLAPSYTHRGETPTQYDSIFNAILMSNHETLIERLLISNATYRSKLQNSQSIASNEELYRILRLCIRESGNLNSFSGASEYIGFDYLDLHSILATSVPEEICIRWLLAVDRIQHGSQEALRLQDFEVSATHLTIHYVKVGAKQEERTATSHQRSTWQYKLLSSHVKRLQKFDALFSSDSKNTQRFFRYPDPFKKPQTLASFGYRDIISTCQPGSILYNHTISKFPRAEKFALYFNTLVRKNESARKCREPRGEHYRGRRHEDSSASVKNLTTNTIAQSRAIVSEDSYGARFATRGENPETNNYIKYTKIEHSAYTTAHTPHVKEFVYKLRSMSLHRMLKRGHFSEAMGELQDADARKTIALLNKTKVITLEGINELLGWGVNLLKDSKIEEFNQLIQHAESMGYSCSPMGALESSKTHEKIVVACGVSAALILSYIEGCRAQKNDSASTERDVALTMQIAYCHLVLEQFDARSVAEGQAILEEYNIPTPLV